MSLLTDEEVKEIRLSIPAVCHHADLIRHTEKFIESKFSALRADNEALKQQVEQGKREAAPEGLIESVARAIYMQWRDADGYLHWQAGGNSLMQDSARRIAATAIAAAPKQEK